MGSDNTHPIFQFRKMKGWSQAELGTRLNVTQTSVSEWENGKKRPKHRAIRRLKELDNTYFDPEMIDLLVTSGAG